MNKFTLPVESKFNSEVGSVIDGALANDFLVMAKRDKHLVKGHSGKEPEYVSRHGSDAETGEPLHITMGQRKGLRIWSPKEKRDLTGLGKTVNIEINLDLDIALRFVAKVALSAGYFVYGDHFRNNVDHDELRTIMNFRATEVGDAIYSMKARVDHRLREPETQNDRILRGMCAAVSPHSLVALTPTSASFSVAVGVLGDYMGMVNVPADTSKFPNDGIFRWGHVVVLNRPRGTRLSLWQMFQEILKASEKSPQTEDPADSSLKG